MDNKLHKLSVFIITQDEVKRLPVAIHAVQNIADEIIVVDSGSTDGTVELAKELGAIVIHRDWAGYANQKTYAAKQCSHNWILNIDADEEVRPELAESIREILSQEEPTHTCYNMRITTLFPGEEKPCKFPHQYNVPRLYHKDFAGIDDTPHSIDDRIKTFNNDNDIGQLKGEAFHRSIKDLSSFIIKQNEYTDDQVKYNLGKGRNFGLVRMSIEFPFALFKFLFIHGHILRGWYGLAISITGAYFRFIRIAKTREAFRVKDLEIKGKGL